MSYTKQFQVKSLSSSRHEKFYTVSLKHDGSWECSCPAWTRQSPRQDCKHVLQIRLQTQVPVAQPVKQTPVSVEVTGRRFR